MAGPDNQEAIGVIKPLDAEEFRSYEYWSPICCTAATFQNPDSSLSFSLT